MPTATLRLDHPQPQPRIPRPWRLMLNLIAGLIAVALIALGTLTLLDLAARHTLLDTLATNASVFTVRSSYTGVRSLAVHAGSGDVHLTSTTASTTLTVLAHVTEGLHTPSRSATLDGAGVLHLKEGCDRWPDTQCNVSYYIAVPSGIGVTARSGAGHVIATGLTTTQPIDLSSSAGDVDAIRVSAPNVRLHTGAGEVRAQLTSPPETLKANSGAGNVTITVPDVTYAVHASSGAGSVSDGSLKIDPAAPRRIDASSGAGDVTIKTAR